MKIFTNDSPSSRAVRTIDQLEGPVSLYDAPGWLASPLSEIVVRNYSMPAAFMGLNGRLRFSVIASLTGSSNSKTVRMKFGGSTINSDGMTVSSQVSYVMQKTIKNQNSASSQIASQTGFISAFGASAATLPQLSINTANAVDVAIVFQTTLETGITLATPSDISGTGSVITVNKIGHGLNSGEYIKTSGSTTAGYNSDPVMITVTSANQFQYTGSGTGTPSTAPTIQRYSKMVLGDYSLEYMPGAN